MKKNNKKSSETLSYKANEKFKLTIYNASIYTVDSTLDSTLLTNCKEEVKGTNARIVLYTVYIIHCILYNVQCTTIDRAKFEQ